MHPAYAIILFTVSSGAGFGLLVWLALFGVLGSVPAERTLECCGFSLSLALIVGGLCASTLHLVRPERVWRAFSQWRTSWLSREGVMARASCIPRLYWRSAGSLASRVDGPIGALALLTIAGAVGTLLTTGMIYASLRTIRQWHQPLTMPIYVVPGLLSGALLLQLLVRIFGISAPYLATLAIALLVADACLKWAYWLRIDGQARTFTAEAAIGRGHLGKVRPLEGPHTQPNFVMREMGYRIARAHAMRLRRLCLLAAFALPLAALLATLEAGALMAAIGAAVAVLSRRVPALPSSAGCSSPRSGTLPCSIMAWTRPDMASARPEQAQGAERSSTRGGEHLWSQGGDRKEEDEGLRV